MIKAEGCGSLKFYGQLDRQKGEICSRRVVKTCGTRVLLVVHELSCSILVTYLCGVLFLPKRCLSRPSSSERNAFVFRMLFLSAPSLPCRALFVFSSCSPSSSAGIPFSHGGDVYSVVASQRVRRSAASGTTSRSDVVVVRHFQARTAMSPPRLCASFQTHSLFPACVCVATDTTIKFFRV